MAYLFMLAKWREFKGEPSSLFQEGQDHTPAVTHSHTWNLIREIIVWPVGRPRVQRNHIKIDFFLSFVLIVQHIF